MSSKYKLAVCQLFHPAIHGLTNTSDPTVIGHYLITCLVEPEEFFNSYYYHESIINNYYDYYDNVFSNKPHPIIRNYRTIVITDWCKFQIVETDMLSGGEFVGYIKTFWIKIIQRKWKKIFKTRKAMISLRKSIKRLRDREITGKFPASCRHYPALN